MNRDAVSTSLPHWPSPVSDVLPAGWCAQAPVGSPVSSSRHRRRRGGFAQGSTGDHASGCSGTVKHSGASFDSRQCRALRHGDETGGRGRPAPLRGSGGADCPQPPVWLSGGMIPVSFPALSRSSAPSHDLQRRQNATPCWLPASDPARLLDLSGVLTPAPYPALSPSSQASPSAPPPPLLGSNIRPK